MQAGGGGCAESERESVGKKLSLSLCIGIKCGGGERRCADAIGVLFAGEIQLPRAMTVDAESSV